MTSTPKLSRQYQVSQFTKGLDLPLPALDKRHLHVIAEVLLLAWQYLQNEQGSLLNTIPEAELNTLMESQLGEMDKVCPEWEMLVRGVSRGKESINFDASSLEKRPDLQIHLTDRAFRLPLAVECKLIDVGANKTVSLYCKDGLSRFIIGDYAWYAVEGFMLAYVRDSAKVATSLTPHLVVCSQENQDPYLTEKLPHPPHPVVPSVGELYCSDHGRKFSGNPGLITIWHLWLS